MAGEKNIIKNKKPESKSPKLGFLKKIFGFKIPEAAIETPREIVSGDFIEKNESTGLIKFLVWLTILGFLYITNNYRAEQKIREINRMEKELKEMRYKYISTKSKLMTLSRQSEVLKILESKGYEKNKEPLKVIKVTEKDIESVKE